MKKILCCMMLMMVAMTVSAMAQMKAYSPPEQDIGCQMVATLSVDGQTVVAFDSQWNIVDLQTPVMLNMEVSAVSVQVVDAVSAPTPAGEVSMTLAAYMWPENRRETMNLRNDMTYHNDVHSQCYNSFTTAHTDTI